MLTSVSIKESEDMKKRFYDGEDRLAIKGVGYDQVRALMEEKLTAADGEE